jgi:hypothetical protein
MLGQLWPTVQALLAGPMSHFGPPVRRGAVARSPRALHVGWCTRRRPSGDRPATGYCPRAPWVLQGGAGQGGGRRGSSEKADGSGAEKQSGTAATQRQ